MSLRATEHSFTGETTPITAYDSTKTSLGSLMIQKSGLNPEDNFVGPMPVAVTRPMEESTVIPGMFPHVISISSTIDWVFLTENSTTTSATRRVIFYEYNKITGSYNRNGFITATFKSALATTTRGFRALRYLHTTGTIEVAAPTSVYSTGTVTVAVAGGTVTGVGTTFATSHVGLMIGFGSNDVTKINCWYPIISITSTTVLIVSGVSSAYAVGTLFVIASCVVTGTGTQFVTEGIAAGANTLSAAGLTSGLGPRIGFGSTDPNQITQWYQIGRLTSDTSINLVTSPGVIAPGTPYVIEELRFVWTMTNATPSLGGLFLLKGVGFMDFTTSGNTFPMIATNINNQRGMYWLKDAATITNQIANGCAVEDEKNKLVHFAYVLEANVAANIRIFKYNLRNTDSVTAGEVTLLAASYYTVGTVTVSSGVVTGSGTTFTAAMVGRQIGFGSTIASTITVWYTIASFSSTTEVTLTDLTYVFGGAAYVIDLSNVIITSTLTSAITGNLSNLSVNNGTIATMKHGPGEALPYFYFVSVSRLYCAAISSIGSGNNVWVVLDNGRQEIPPGGILTFPATGAMQNIQYLEIIDRLIITTYASGIGSHRQYVTRYPEGSSTYNVPFDHIFGIDDKQQDQSILSSQGAIHFNTGSQILSLDSSSNGVVHIIKNSTNISLNQMYALPFSVHWTYAHTTNPGNHQRIISPSISTIGCIKFDQLLIMDEEFIGAGELRLSPEAFRTYYRTSDITTNATNSWILLQYDGDLSAVAPADAIQFMFEFYTIGTTCLPARIFKLIVTYEDGMTDSHYQMSSLLSDITAKTFTWRFSQSFNETVPTLKIQLFNAETNVLLTSDTTLTTASGTWSKSIDGGVNFVAYDTNDKSNDNTYIRYTSTSGSTDNVRVKALLTQN